MGIGSGYKAFATVSEEKARITMQGLFPGEQFSYARMRRQSPRRVLLVNHG